MVLVTQSTNTIFCFVISSYLFCKTLEWSAHADWNFLDSSQYNESRAGA